MVDPRETASQAVGTRRLDAAFEKVVLALDAAVLGGAFLGAYAIRQRWVGYGELHPFQDYLWILAMVVPTWLALSRANGLTVPHSYATPQRAAFLTLKAHTVGALLLLSTMYLMRAVEVSRLLMQTFLVVGAVALLIERLAIRAYLRARAHNGHARIQRMLVIGANSAAARLHQRLRESPNWDAEITGFIVTTGANAPGREYCGAPVLGELADIPAVLDSMVVDEVVMADPRLDPQAIELIVDHCLTRGLTYCTLMRVPSVEHARHHAEALGDGLYFMALESTPRNPLHLAVKRLIDIVGACVGLVVCGIVTVFLAPLVWLKSPGPIIFKQTRVGRNGRHFTLYKFRSMHVSAERDKEALLAQNQMSGPLFKIRHDPRVTGLGRYLRRTYIDELPQFWNVLKGDMSLVGTRPPTPDEVSQYSPRHRRRLSVRPGITGLWQSQGNGRVSDFEDVVRLDCEYIDRWSLWLDLRILLRTFATVVRRAGH